jgi:FkbM family methyltransferase
MTFISYAQNFEDVILWRALRDVENGCYIDVGAADPEKDSVTKAFYERGWTGINIEPSSEHHAKLVEARPNDLNLKLVVGRAAGVASFNVIEGTGLSTLDQAIAERHRDAGWAFRTETIPVLTLTQICDSHPHDAVHFLKIDVEGAEGDVLAGLDLHRIRPWIIVIEATEPLSTASTRQQWEPLVTSRGYEFVYFDGLNCFYVASEQSRLKERFTAPPNVFDDFLRISEWRFQQDAAHNAAELEGVRKHADGLERKVKLFEQEITNRDVALIEKAEHIEKLEQRHQRDASVIRNLESKDQKLRSMLAHADALEKQLKQATARVSDLEGELGQLHQRADRAVALENQLRAVYLSDSWRMTRPVRAFSRRVRRMLLASLGRQTDHLLTTHESLFAMVSDAGAGRMVTHEQPALPDSSPAVRNGNEAVRPRDEADLPYSARPLFRRIATRVRHTA